MTIQHQDVLIIGAGLSGIGAACHLTRKCPDKSIAILERRNAVGGTWDLFRYPGIRSDSDMYTFGFNFKPWLSPRVLADGASIKQYVAEAAEEYGVDKAIRFGRKVATADWSSKDQLWTVSTTDEQGGNPETWTARFLLGCTGYYNYDTGFRPAFPGEKDFKGQIVHPQFWPENFDYSGKRVVIIGSGATAITLVPNMTDKAEHVTMLQRSPTYILSVPAVDPLSRVLQAALPAKVAYRLNRARNIGIQRLLYQTARAKPQVVRRFILGMAKRQLKGSNVDIRHFSPSYNPWDQRLCVVPNGDLFKVLREGKASIETDHIQRFTKDGILLKSGQEIKADIIVTATGLDVQLLGGVAVSIDGAAIPISQKLTYKGVLVDGVPNAAMIFGYTNASWTLKADIASEYFCRVLQHMDKKGYRTFKARGDESQLTEDTVFGSLSAGYVRRAADRLPRQGKSAPWKITQDYMSDIPVLRYSSIADDILEFDGKVGKKPSGLEQRALRAASTVADLVTAPLKGALGRG